MQAGTLISAVIAPGKGQPGAQNSGAAGAGLFTQALMAVLGGAAAGGTQSPTPGIAGASQGSATTGNAAGDNPGDGQDAGLGPIVNPATEIAATGNAVSGAPGLEVAGAATEIGQANAQQHAGDAAKAVANGLALTVQAPGGENGDAPATRETPNHALGTLLAGGGAKSGGATDITPTAAATGEAAAPGGESSIILVDGVDGPRTAGAEGPDRLGLAVETPSTDKSAVVNAQSAIRISALNEAPSKAADAPAATAQDAPRAAVLSAASVGDSAADGSGDRPPTPRTANPQAAAAAGDAEFTLQSVSSAGESATQGNVAAGAHTSASANASDGTSLSGLPARPANPALVNAQVAVHITRAAAEGLDRITIRLQPESLGRVDIRLEIGNDGRMTAIILAEKADTLDMLQRDARGLERALQEAGLKTDSGSLSFHLRGHGGDGTDFARHMNESETGDAGADDGLAADQSDEPDPASESTYAGYGLLDIHV